MTGRPSRTPSAPRTPPPQGPWGAPPPEKLHACQVAAPNAIWWPIIYTGGNAEVLLHLFCPTSQSALLKDTHFYTESITYVGRELIGASTVLSGTHLRLIFSCVGAARGCCVGEYR